MSASISVCYAENPFASTHSLDTNPFDDPTPPQSQSTDTRLEELRQRELELERREQELNRKAEHIRQHGKNNWPPFFPLIFHSISEEIPEASQPLITRIYQLWLVLLGTLVLNMIACIFILIAGSSDGGRDVGASIGYLFVISAASFLLWYRPIYNGYMKEQALYYYLYFVFGGFHLLFSVYMIVGVPSTGSAGLIQTIQMFVNHHWAAAILGLVATIGWIVQGLGNAFYYRQIYAHHTAAGHTMEKAKTELASHGAKAYFTRG
ncbi:scamp family-domain-containing protein [Armillaria novae-zelandiae]|uniref:Scamp family-domain-containing protein n=1 Tax=Armillaria novae-zelandiae TaxID=153914 RepID=A0AA39PH04_9AGAR|nr:scamp family-domain-containing protein [Armillaria novae-zelandiae]